MLLVRIWTLKIQNAYWKWTHSVVAAWSPCCFRPSWQTLEWSQATSQTELVVSNRQSQTLTSVEELFGHAVRHGARWLWCLGSFTLQSAATGAKASMFSTFRHIHIGCSTRMFHLGIHWLVHWVWEGWQIFKAPSAASRDPRQHLRFHLLVINYKCRKMKKRKESSFEA